MRDPDRIPEVLRMLETAWKQSPDLRLGQLIVCASTLGNKYSIDPFYIEDDAMVIGLTKFIEQLG